MQGIPVYPGLQVSASDPVMSPIVKDPIQDYALHPLVIALVSFSLERFLGLALASRLGCF